MCIRDSLREVSLTVRTPAARKSFAWAVRTLYRRGGLSADLIREAALAELDPADQAPLLAEAPNPAQPVS
eukprot:1861133-Alexandrium_andersonii.AAC.1